MKPATLDYWYANHCDREVLCLTLQISAIWFDWKSSLPEPTDLAAGLRKQRSPTTSVRVERVSRRCRLSCALPKSSTWNTAEKDHAFVWFGSAALQMTKSACLIWN